MQKFLQFKHQSFYKLALSFLMEVAMQNQSTQNRKLVIFLQYIKKSAATAFVFYEGAFMFVVICSEWFNLSFLRIKCFENCFTLNNQSLWNLYLQLSYRLVLKYVFSKKATDCRRQWFHVNYNTKTIWLVVFRLLVLFMGILN